MTEESMVGRLWMWILRCTQNDNLGCHARPDRESVGGPQKRTSLYSATQEHVFVSPLQYATGVVLLFSQTTHGHSSHAAFCVVAL